VQIDGIWHTGVVVDGVEYFFGQGIQQCPAGRSAFGAPLEVHNLGYVMSLPSELTPPFAVKHYFQCLLCATVAFCVYSQACLSVPSRRDRLVFYINSQALVPSVRDESVFYLYSHALLSVQYVSRSDIMVRMILMHAWCGGHVSPVE
jgi:hypothetical protein